MSFYARYPSNSGSAGVSSLNGLAGALTLVAGSGITITPSGSNITISSTGAGQSIIIDTYTLTPTDITNRGVILSQIPTVAAKVVVLVDSAPGQAYGVDYIVDSNLSPNKTLDWTGLGLDGELAAGDILEVIYY